MPSYSTWMRGTLGRPWQGKMPGSSLDSLLVSLHLSLCFERILCIACTVDAVRNRWRASTMLPTLHFPKTFLLQNISLKPFLCWRNGLSLSGTQNASGISQTFSLEPPLAPKCWSVCVCCHAVLEKIPAESVNWSTSECKHSLMLTFTRLQLAKSMSKFLWHTATTEHNVLSGMGCSCNLLCKHWFSSVSVLCNGLFLWMLTVKCVLFTFIWLVAPRQSISEIGRCDS